MNAIRYHASMEERVLITKEALLATVYEDGMESIAKKVFSSLVEQLFDLFSLRDFNFSVNKTVGLFNCYVPKIISNFLI